MPTSADVTITPTILVPGAESVDLVASGTAVNAAQTFRYKAPPLDQFPPSRGGESRFMLVMEELNAGAAVITVEAGDRTSLLAEYGEETLSLAQADLKVVILIAGRHLKTDGYIKGLVSTNNCRIRVLWLPPGY